MRQTNVTKIENWRDIHMAPAITREIQSNTVGQPSPMASKGGQKNCVSCYENGRIEGHIYHARSCREYLSQRAWTKRVSKLLENTVPWHERPVPQVSYEAPRFPLPAVMPEVKEFRRALRALGDWQRDVMGASKVVGTCAQCLYETVTDGAPLAKIAHTCGKIEPVVAPKRRRAKVTA